jgi:multidrug efflux pump
MWVQAAPPPATRCVLEEATRRFIAPPAAAANWPAVNTTFRAPLRQLRVDVDRDKALLLGVPVQDVYGAIQAQFGVARREPVPDQYGRVWQVVLESAHRSTAASRRTSVAATPFRQGAIVRRRLLVTTCRVTGPDVLPRFNGLPPPRSTATRRPVTAPVRPCSALQEVARDTLPPGFTIAWSGLACARKPTGRHLRAGLRARPAGGVPGAGGAVTSPGDCRWR